MRMALGRKEKIARTCESIDFIRHHEDANDDENADDTLSQFSGRKIVSVADCRDSDDAKIKSAPEIQFIFHGRSFRVSHEVTELYLCELDNACENEDERENNDRDSHALLYDGSETLNELKSAQDSEDAHDSKNSHE